MTTDIAIGGGNLPAEPNSFVGRERDLAELALLLGEVRALTLCGPGGIGKTRLALRLACEIVPGFPDGAWLVELGDTEDPALVPQRVAAVLGIREEPDRPLAETLADVLRPRRMVLILDTCEHVVDACASLVQQLLASCPLLRLIATSREPLRVRGETAWRVPPLELPGQLTDLSGRDMAGHEAIRLFTERAAAVRPGFALSTENTGTVVRLCRTLDGIPLAIELAAARVRALSVEQIAGRLGDRFRLLASGDRTAPPRQQTLRATLDWSYELLTGPEQVLLRRLSVFAGWDLDMAEQVCAGHEITAPMVLDLLAALIDKSLVTVDAELDGDARYRLLDMIREYAAARLAASGEETVVRVRQRDYLLSMAESIVDRAFVRGDPPWPERVAMYRRVHAERANLVAALALTADRGEAELGLRLCCALRSPWVAYGDVTEGARWFDRFLGMDDQVSQAVRARALMLRAELAFEQQDYAAAAGCAQAGIDLCLPSAGPSEAGGHRLLALVSLRAGRHDAALDSADAAVAAARAAGDEWEEGLAQSTRAAVLARQGSLNDAQRAYETALDVLRDNNGWGVAQTLYGFGALARARRDYPAALRHFDAALALYRAIDARPEIARCLAGVGWVALSQRDLALARSSLTESMQLSLAIGQRLAIARGIEALAVLALAEGDPARAIRLEGAGRALRDAAGHVSPAPARARIDALFDAARQQLGPAAAAALLAEGRAMSREEAIRYGTEAAAAAPPGGAEGVAGQPPSPGGGSSALTTREQEIAALIARGLSNRRIAAELVISPATAARHVANIFTKLGFSSRAQVAAWAADRGSGNRS
ncbi:MAG TPA: LuxR C-terminal-related transcriptional regulator [Streptosporangiaceae bacterium]|nr:LuxR C-terminal-related transcriptional regulator [Streptosporangiaceae bacterium]